MDLKQELIDRLGVPENWDKYDYQTQRYSFDDMQEVLEDIVEKLTIPVVRCSFYKFAKQYVTIKDAEGNEQKFSDRQLNEIKEMEEMMNKGYELRFVHLRRGTQLRWVKK